MEFSHDRDRTMVVLRRPKHSSALNAEALVGSFVAEWVLGKEYEVDCTFERDVRTGARTDCSNAAAEIGVASANSAGMIRRTLIAS